MSTQRRDKLLETPYHAAGVNLAPYSSCAVRCAGPCPARKFNEQHFQTDATKQAGGPSPRHTSGRCENCRTGRFAERMLKQRRTHACFGVALSHYESFALGAAGARRAAARGLSQPLNQDTFESWLGRVPGDGHPLERRQGRGDAGGARRQAHARRAWRRSGAAGPAHRARDNGRHLSHLESHCAADLQLCPGMRLHVDKLQLHEVICSSLQVRWPGTSKMKRRSCAIKCTLIF